MNKLPRGAPRSRAAPQPCAPPTHPGVGVRAVGIPGAIVTVLLGATLFSTALLSGCGQRGALYLPDRNGRVITRPARTPANASGPAATSAPDSAPTTGNPSEASTPGPNAPAAL